MKDLNQYKADFLKLFGTNQIIKSVGSLSNLPQSFIVFNNSKSFEGYNKKTFQYVLNPQKEIRWIWSAENKKPIHLSFYYQSTFKSKMYGLGTKLLFAIGQKRRLADGEFTVYTKEHKLPFEIKFNGLGVIEYAFFLGTKGPNRKIISVGVNQLKEFFYLKESTSVISNLKVKNEKKALMHTTDLELSSVVIPKIESFTNNSLLVKAPSLNEKHNKGAFTESHSKFFKELYAKSTMFSSKNDEHSLINYVKYELGQLKQDDRIENSMILIKSLKKLWQTLKNDHYLFTFSHGDFTPWNMKQTKNGLYLFDWELAERRPILFDVFHYVYQDEIMVKRGDFRTIKSRLDKILAQEEMAEIIGEFKMDVTEYHKLYLLTNITYYLNYYRLQEDLHEQVFWLFDVWQQALNYMLDQDGVLPRKNDFIGELFIYLNKHHYAVMKGRENTKLLYQENSDIDLLVMKEDLEGIIKFINQHNAVEKISLVKTSYMHNVKIQFKNMEFLSLDLIIRFKRKSSTFMDPKKVLRGTKQVDGVKFASPRFDYEYISKFYLLNGARIPLKYLASFSKLYYKDQERVLIHLNNIFDTQFTKIEEFNNLKFIKSITKANIVDRFNYILDTLKLKLLRRGKVITLSGVDGAGKTTILNELAAKLKNHYREEVVVLRHRPSLFPILSSYKYGKKNAEKRAANTLPRTGGNKSTISSYLRFGYYFLDYIVGQPIIFFKYIISGKTVIYDRYYFDFISDPKRSNLSISNKITRPLYKLIYKPNLNILLYANSEEILKRKQELPKEEIESLTENYIELFNDLQKEQRQEYLTINNQDINITLNTILKAYTKA